MSFLIATKVATKLEALGYEVDVRESRRSDSCYVTATRDGETIAEMRNVTIRVSDHLNPARRMMRVADSHDRAIACEIEIRTDRSRAWTWAVEVAVDHLEGRTTIDPFSPRTK